VLGCRCATHWHLASTELGAEEEPTKKSDPSDVA
jgi:hypothetical protein